MNYPLTSIAEIVGRVIRRTGLKDTSLIPDINEWLAEGLELLQTSVAMEKDFTTVTSSFHKAKYPCGMAELYGVEYCGTRLRYNNGDRDARSPWSPQSTPNTIEDGIFVSTTTQQNTPSGNFIYTSKFEQVLSFPWHATQWYKTDGRYILTSFETGDITLYYGKIPTDRDGFLMVPDEGNYKEALTYLIRERLCARGYEFGKLSELQLHQLFETYQARAIGNITYPSPEKVQASVDAMTRLLPDMNRYEDFFTTTGPETPYGMI